jgi:PAS domain S-box-containing protein
MADVASFHPFDPSPSNERLPLVPDVPGQPDALMTEDYRYRQLVEAVTDYAIFMLDPHGFVTSWNPGAQRFKGYLSAEIIGKHFSIFYTEDDRRRRIPEKALETAMREDRFEQEGWRVRKDGSRFWAHVVIDPIRAPSGEIIGFAKITRDLSERRQALEFLRRSEEQFRRFVRSVTDYSIYMVDAGGRITNWNLGAQRSRRYAPQEIIGEHFSCFYTAEDREAGAPEAALMAAARDGRSEAEGWRVRQDGTRFMANVVIEAIPDENGQIIGYAVITHDITEQRETQQALEEAREALFQSQKMEAIGQLTGGLAHDFNNLLTGILGSLQLAQVRLAQGCTEDIGRYLEMAQVSAKRAAAVTHRLLAFARRQALDPKPTNIRDLVQEMHELVRRTMGPGIEVELIAAEELWCVLVDANQLENALLNLCINARDAMPDGGKLTIEAGNEDVDEELASERDLPPGAYVALSVRDTGTGMPRDVIEHAFDPFFTTKPIGEGTGLGLSMVYGFVRQSGGQACIGSEIGGGTSVTLYLPRHLGVPVAADIECEQPEATAVRHGTTALVVDDEAPVRSLIAEILADMGVHVTEADGGHAALKIIETSRQIDLLVTDVGLPGGMNGRQLADAAIALCPGLKVLFITGYAENAVMRNGRLPAQMHVLTKPFSLDNLSAKVKDIL